MMKRLLTWLAAPFVVLALLGGPSVQPAEGQSNFGVQGNWGSDTDFGLGGRLVVNIPDVNLEGAGSFDVYFPDADFDFWEINANLFYHFHLPDSPSVLPYLGGGLNIARFSNGASDTEAGLNIGGGVRFPTGNVSPFVEGRGVVGDASQFVVTAGILFGPAFYR